MPFEFIGCSSQSCSSTLDCPAGLLCLRSGGEKKCVRKPEHIASKEPSLEPQQADAADETKDSLPSDRLVRDDSTDKKTIDSITDTVPDPTVQRGRKPIKGDLVINEINADPKTVGGDANGDGVVSGDDDEFVEIVNTTSELLDLSGIVLSNSKKNVFTFPEGTSLPASTALVVFGGGLAGDSLINTGKPHPKFNDSLIYTTSSLGLSNGGLLVSLKDKDGLVLSSLGYGSANPDCPKVSDQSATLWPDLTGKCTLHTVASSSGKLFSPGSRVGGGKFSDPAPTPEPVVEMIPDAGGEVTPPEKTVMETIVEKAPDVPQGPTPQVGELVINEVLADPDSIKGDANKDGTSSTRNDEFLEIVNNSTKSLQVAGIYLFFTKNKPLFVLKPLLLPAKGVILLFRGGMVGDTEINTGKPHSKFNGAYVYTGLKASLTNTGSQMIQIKDTTGQVIATFSYGTSPCRGDKNQSMTLSPDLTGKCALHSTVKAGVLFSPGTKIDGSAF